jgi:hypothetical protein
MCNVDITLFEIHHIQSKKFSSESVLILSSPTADFEVANTRDDSSGFLFNLLPRLHITAMSAH